MRLIKAAWKILVGIKDALVLAAMLLFFGLLFAALSSRPESAVITDGALVVDLDGTIAEQPAAADPFAFASGGAPGREIRLRDLILALDAARGDARVKAVVLDMDRFAGGYPAAVAEVGRAVARVRASGKPVLAYATAYTDSGYLIAANASEVWTAPLGGVLLLGPGGSQLYYKGLIDKLGVNVHVYRVGRYKSFVEPFTRTDQSPEAEEASRALYGALFGQWQEAVAKARPKARIQPLLNAPDKVMAATGGDMAQAALRLGLVDRLGDRVAFGQRVAKLAGVAPDKPLGEFNRIRFASWVKANAPKPTGDAIGVLTVAGDIVDGKAGAGSAGGDTVVKAMLEGLATEKLKALVVRVDSPGGSAFASEQIRQAILQAKAKKLPVVISMGSLAASGGYWVSTAGDVIFAEPNTITGSIGIFGILPTFENALAKLGVTADGVRTTPLSGQPDVYAGTNPVVDAVFQSGIEHGYRQFLTRVAQARRMTPARVDQIAQGRVWDGGTARQIGLVDRFGTIDDAVAEAAKRAKLDPAKVHRVYLGEKQSWTDRLVEAIADRNRGEDADVAGDLFTRLAAGRRAVLAQALGDARRLASGPAIQARCLECAGFGAPRRDAGDARLLDLLIARLMR